MIRALVDGALAVLLAPACAICQAVLERPLDGAVCAGCWSRLAVFSPPVCCRCGDALPSLRGGETCAVCSVELGPIAAARSLGPYDGVLAELVLACKYARRPTVADGLGARLRPLLTAWDEPIDLVVPVPLHPRRERARGFNQAERLARALGPPLCLALARRRHTPPQAGTTSAARHANVREAFTLTRQARLVTRRSVLLVDDVLTTGATLVAAAETLRAAQPGRLLAVTAARAELGRR